MRRVLVIGSPGAGKSTLSHFLADRTGLPLYHLDKLHWLPGWVERDADEAGGEVAEIAARERWIIDGNYGSTMMARLARADTVVWLDYSSGVCLARVLKRWWQFRKDGRPDVAEGCPERLNLGFLLYVIGFRRAWRNRNAAALTDFGGAVFHHATPAETKAWLAREWPSPNRA